MQSHSLITWNTILRICVNVKIICYTFVIDLDRDDDGIFDEFGDDFIADWNAGDVLDILRVDNLLDVHNVGNSIDINDLVAMSLVRQDDSSTDIVLEIYDNDIGPNHSNSEEANLLGTVQFAGVSFNSNTEITTYIDQDAGNIIV